MIDRFRTRYPQLQTEALRWMYALGWTALITVLLVQSSTRPIIGPAAPQGEPDFARELLLNSGHIVAFSVFTLLWWWALVTRIPPLRALMMAVVFAIGFGILTELLQSLVPDRNASLGDVAVNTLSSLGMAGWIFRDHIRPHQNNRA